MLRDVPRRQSKSGRKPVMPGTLRERTFSVYQPWRSRHGDQTDSIPASTPTDTFRPRVFLLANRRPLANRTAQILVLAASQSIWPVEPANTRQDNQLMRILPYRSVRVKLRMDRFGTKIPGNRRPSSFRGGGGTGREDQFPPLAHFSCKNGASTVRRRYHPRNRHIFTMSRGSPADNAKESVCNDCKSIHPMTGTQRIGICEAPGTFFRPSCSGYGRRS